MLINAPSKIGIILAYRYVGYNQVQLNAGGKNMVGACFVKVGTETDVKLSELSINGYENSSYYLETVCEFNATFQRRASNGLPYATYAYTDVTDDCETWNGGSWSDVDSGADITAENDVTLTAGDGLWFDTPALEDCSGFYLQTSGQVLNGDVAFELNAGGKIGACNMMPTVAKMSQVEIQGYEDSSYYLETVCEFNLTMQSLGSNGMPLATYAYTDVTDDCETWNGGQWSNVDTGDDITSEDDVEIGAGEGYWVDCPALEDCEKFTMVFPACID